MSSPQITTILGRCCCCAATGAAVIAATDMVVSKSRAFVIFMMMASLLQSRRWIARARRICSSRRVETRGLWTQVSGGRYSANALLGLRLQSARFVGRVDVGLYLRCLLWVPQNGRERGVKAASPLLQELRWCGRGKKRSRE